MNHGLKNNLFIKFHSINEFLKKSLSTEGFYATSLNELNDPVEKIEHVIISRSAESKYSLDYRNKCGVYCVTEYSSRHFSSHLLPMWAYYGDKHNGVCLVLQAKEVNAKNMQKINYIDIKNKISIDVKDENEYQVAKKSLAYKLKPWHNEREHRLIFPPEETGRMHSWSKYFTLNQIIFGYNCKPELINEVISWLSDNLLERTKNHKDAFDYLEIMQVREPFSTISDMHPHRIMFEKRELLSMTGWTDAYRHNNYKFYSIGSLYKGQIPDFLMPDLSKQLSL
jgi:hypothetical protein